MDVGEILFYATDIPEGKRVFVATMYFESDLDRMVARLRGNVISRIPKNFVGMGIVEDRLESSLHA